MEAIANAQPPRVRIAQALCERIRRGEIALGTSLPTEMDLSEQFGVSRPTVRAALALLEEEGVLGRDKSRARILMKAAVRSPLANTVAMLAGSPEIPVYQKASGWWVNVQEGAVEAIRAARCHTLLLDIEGMDDGMVAHLARQRPRGLIVLRSASLGGRGKALLANLQAAGLAIVVGDDDADLTHLDTVASDHAQGAYDLTKWLLTTGKRRILRTFPHHAQDGFSQMWVAQRQAGFLRAMAEAGLEALPLVRYRSSGREPGTAEEAEILAHTVAGYLHGQFRQWPDIDTIMVPSDGLVYQTAAACRILGRKPGRDVTIVGYDNYWRDCRERQWESYTPPATVDKHNPEIGRALVETLLARTTNKLGEAPCRRLIRAELVLTDDDSAGLANSTARNQS